MRRSTIIGAVATLALGTTGCGSNEEQTTEPIDSLQAEFSVEHCASVAADVTVTGDIDPPVTSPRTYDNCYKGYVVDLLDLQGSHDKIRIGWVDTLPSNPTSCSGSKLAAHFYLRADSSDTTNNASVVGGTAGELAFEGGGWTLFQDNEVYGHWTSVNGFCAFDDVYVDNLRAGLDYRIAATARTPGQATRKVDVRTFDDR